MSKWPKRKLIHILFYSLVQIPTFFYGVYRCSNRRDGLVEYPFITAEAIKSDSSVIYDEEGAGIGEITVQRNNDGLICSIKGIEVHGVSVLEKEYTWKKIEYHNMHFILKDHDSERYWYCDTGDSILLINKVRKKKYADWWFGGKKEDAYFFCEVSKEHYNWMLDRDMPLQTVVFIDEDKKMYFCIFMQ